MMDEEDILIDNFNKKIMDDLTYFLPAIPNIEIGDTTNGRLIKLKTYPEENGNIPYDIFFELQYMLYTRKQRYPEISKMIVSDLSLTKIIPNFPVPRGLMIKIKYE